MHEGGRVMGGLGKWLAGEASGLVQNGSMQVVHAWDGYTVGTKLAGPGAG